MMELLEKLNASRIAAYRACPRDIQEHAGKEESVSAGGYGYRQILELVQNGADAILESSQKGISDARARIEVRLAGKYLYVANTGAPLSERGLESLLSSDVSPKRGNQIGRFGLGFKSLLRLGGTIDIFTSKSGTIRFDPERCRRELRMEFGVHVTPGLRLAWPLDDSARSSDPELESLHWAETIVRAEVSAAGLREHLEAEIQDFPREFLLFLDYPIDLCLCTETAHPISVRVEHHDAVRILHTQDEQVYWRVFSREVTVVDHDAMVDATSIHARKAVPLAWATPINAKRDEAGRFWAFFPTRTPTYISGILNAPWKLNSDRNSLVRGEWNDALMREAVKLVVEHLPSLSTPEDFGRPLDSFPRKPDRQDEDAVPMLNAIWTELLDAPVIPNCNGELKRARELYRHPQDSQDLASLWMELAGPDSRALLVHPSCLDGHRCSRIGALAERLRAQRIAAQEGVPFAPCGVDGWFGAVASTETGLALKVLHLAKKYHSSCKTHEWALALNGAAIIPTENGQLRKAGDVVLLPAGSHAPPGYHAVSHALSCHGEASRILKDIFDVRFLDDRTWETILSKLLPVIGFYGTVNANEWRDFWSNLRSAPREIALRFLEKNRNQVRVHRRDGNWSLPHELLLPGAIIHDDDALNAALLVNKDTHPGDDDLLDSLGLSDYPNGTVQARDFPGLVDWRSHWVTYYLQHKNGSPREYSLNPQRVDLPLAARFLSSLKGAANARLTAELLPLLQQCPPTCKFGHDTVEKYPVIHIPHPLPWLLRRYGQVAIGGASVPLHVFLERDDVMARSLSQFPGYLPELTPEISKLLKTTGAPASVVHEEEIRSLWQTCIMAVATTARIKSDELSALWSAAAMDRVVPRSLTTAGGPVPLTGVFVTKSHDLARRVGAMGKLVVTLDDQAFRLWRENGARPLSELIRPEWDDISCPELLLVEVFPEIDSVLGAEARRNARCQPVHGLHVVAGERSERLPCLLWEDCLLIDLVQLRGLSFQRRITELIKAVAPSKWLAAPMEEALARIADASVHSKRTAVAAKPDLPSRLLAAVEGRVAPLLEALGHMAGSPLLTDYPPKQIASLVLAQHGPATLSVLKESLAEAGLQPPGRWNSSEARTFVANLGFPEVFAEAAAARRDPEEIINGPVRLPPLHDFQHEVLDGIDSLLAMPEPRRRAVVSLPTGGGKTRVTVEAAVRLVLAPAGSSRSVIWIAQSDELCEQAVQAFRQVWLNLGADRTDLRIARLWGGNPNPAQQDRAKPLVIVASIQTLNARMGSDQLEWLKQPGLVVVDECHHAITPSYTSLLRWLDADAQRSGATLSNEPPVLGLSATPFRMDDDESRRLAARFSNRWFPADQADLHRRLLNQGVLATVINEPLDSGVGLTPEEQRLFAENIEQLDGIGFERVLEDLNQRLAGVEERNRRIIGVVELAPQRSILLFANSVRHATEMSTRLNLIGIPAAAISGDTPRIARRYFLERFQRGELRVLCNHSVLTTGFDAPSTDMILIARQVFSPVRYMQIVGRGLRGVKNGGTPDCRIVTVLDNLGRFQDRHPYHYCAKYFRSLNEHPAQSNTQ